jgi:chromosome segregation ATPase
MHGASEAANEQEKRVQVMSEEELRRCKEELKEVQAQHSLSLERHDAERQLLQLEADHYKVKIADLEQQNSALDGKLATACEKLNSCQPEKYKADLQKIIRDMEIMASELMEKKNSHELEIEQARAERDASRQELEKCREQVQTLEQSLQNYKKAGHILAQDVVDFSAGLMQSVTTPRHQPTSDGDC